VDGVHDLGGMQGFGPVWVEFDEPVFHHDWERRVFGLNFASLPTTEDGFRYAIERMGAMAYLTTSYYEHWLAAMETIAVEEGVVSGDELAAAGTAAAAGARPPRRDDPLAARRLVAEVTTPPAAGPEPAVGAPEPAPVGFRPGDRVRVRHASPPGHTRCPRYVRGVHGVIGAVHGRFRLPDASAARREVSEPLYSVSFRARDLWGEGDHVVSLDLWESYLERGATDG
jgi:nitrile hydratase beta subunit